MRKGFLIYKRFVCVLLVVLLSASAIVNVCAYENIVAREIQNSDIIKQFTTLKKLGVFSFNDIDEIEPDRKVTRAEFADYTIKTLGIDVYNVEQIYFSDVRLDYWAIGSINMLVKLGAVNGTNTGTFEPESPITYEQACKILLSLAGYRGYIEAKNYTNPMINYVMQANQLKLGPINDTNNSDGLTFFNVVELLYNAMKMNSVTAFNNKATVSDETLFEVYRDVHIVKGRLETWFGGSITDRVSDALDEVYIDSEKYTVDNDIQIEPNFGNMVEITYLEHSEDEKTIIYLENCDTTSESILIETDRIIDFDLSGYKISYYKDGDKDKKTNVNIDTGAKVVYNGEISDKRMTDIFNDIINGKVYGTVKIVKSEKSGYDIVIFKLYKDFVISSYDEDNEVYYGDSIDLKRIDISTYENINILDSNHNRITLPKAKNTVIAISESENGRYLELVQCLDMRNGNVDSVYPGNNKITVSETEYELTDFALSQNNLGALVNQSIEFTLNLEGKIANIILDGGGYLIGYITNLAVKKYAFEQKPIMRMYLPDNNELKDFEFAKSVKIDGIAYKSDDFEKILKNIPEVTVTKINGEYAVNVSRQIIRYLCNKDGEINEIDTFVLGKAENPENSLSRICDGTTEMRYLSNNKRFGMNCIYDAKNTKLIFVPQVSVDGKIKVDDKTIDEKIDLYNSDIKLVNDRLYYVESYKLNESNYYQDIIVIRVKPTREDEGAFMFAETQCTFDENEGIPVNEIVGIRDNVKVNYIINDMSLIADIEQGDIIRADIDPSGREVLKITKLFDKGTMSMANNTEDSYFYTGVPDKKGDSFRVPMYNLSKSFVYSINNGIIRSTYDFYDMDKMIYNEMIAASSVPITVFNPESRTDIVSIGKTSDIVAYDTDGSNCSEIVAFAYYGTIKQLFVYNNRNN